MDTNTLNFLIFNLKFNERKTYQQISDILRLKYSVDMNTKSIENRFLRNKNIFIDNNGKFVKTGKIKEIQPLNITNSDYTDETNIKLLQRENTNLKKILTEERHKTNKLVESCINSISKLNFKPNYKIPKKINSKHELEFHLLRSDAQVGQEVKLEDTNGLGNYSYDIYLKRLERLTEKIISFYESDHKSLGLNKLVIPMLGDHVEGENIYKGQQFYIDLPLVDQVFNSLNAEVTKFLDPLSKIFNEIEIYCVWGNHGRSGLPGQNHHRTNWDYVFYRCLETALLKYKNIKINISQSPAMLVEHGDFLFCYKHGDDVKSWMGLPYYGLDRMAKKTSHMFNKIINYTCVGHFHNPANINDEMLVNGTMVGGSMLSINILSANSVPSQKCFYFDKKHGINRETNLYLDNPIVLNPDINGIYTPIK